LKEFRKVEIFHLCADVSIKKPRRYMAIPKTNKTKKTDKNSLKMVQSLVFEKYLTVFRILIDRNMKIPDSKL
jgi:hypothetical protein